MKNACGILFCYNEEHILAECLSHYLRQGIDLVLADNHSTDSSVAIARTFQQNNDTEGRITDILHIETQGFQWQKILRRACDYMHASLSDYEWIVLIDSDSFYYSPVKGLPLLGFMEHVSRAGYNIINGALHEFYPTEKDDPLILSPLERLRYCHLHLRPDYPQHKIFRYHPTVDFYTRSGHICLRENPRVFPLKFIFEHYPWVSYEHALKKIFKDRNSRLVERSISPEAHPQYLGLLPVKEELVRESCGLKLYDRDKLSVSNRKLSWLTRFALLYKIAGSAKTGLRSLWFLLGRGRAAAGDFVLLWAVNKRWLTRHLRELFVQAGRELRKSADYSHPPHRQVAVSEIIRQKDVVYGLPEDFHFLMTNFCNARCAFCNQYPSAEMKEMRFRDFLTMLSHIPTTKRTFYLSGGGEPLLCRDLFDIIRHVNAAYPETAVRIITNGLLIAQCADQLSRHKIDQLIISVHGGSRETSNAIFQVNGYDVFDNLKVLNERLKKSGNTIRKAFSCVVSQRNIDEIPLIIKMAGKLGVKEVKVLFRRFYRHTGAQEGRFDGQDSLFFAQKKYNKAINSAKTLARRTGIALSCDPLFLSTPVERPCFQPWQNIVIDWDGNIYPCTGGEALFYNKVRSGDYYFGNLLQENLAQCWNNNMYIMIRRTCSRNYKRKWVAECGDCHNSLCFKGPDMESRHVMRRHDAGETVPRSCADLYKRH
ncbi:MAG: SPASM domain-containing protein [Candidatus Omnitrophica bacterium]|nr:SPASM domain-containing protein [Candidatus Omnitrophota bacterium]